MPGEGRSPYGPARGRRAADRKAGGVVASSDDVSPSTRFVGVSGDRFVGFEVQVALDWKAEFAAHGAKLEKAHVAELGLPEAEIAEAEGDVIEPELGQEPGALGVYLAHGCGNGRRPKGESESRL